MDDCQHIQSIFENPKNRAAWLNALSTTQSVLRHSPIKAKLLHAFRCSTCKEISNGSNFLCLQCGFCGCWNGSHFEQHSKETGHLFGINAQTELVFCFQCMDYVGDFDLFRDAALANRWDYYEEYTNVPTVDQIDGMAGLVNMGSTCYMSSIMQCIIHNPYMIRYFMCQQHSNNCTLKMASNCTSCAISSIIADFYGNSVQNDYKSKKNNNNKHEGFINLLTCSWKVNENMAGYSQQDAHEYWQFILNHIHQDYKSSMHSHSDDKLCNCVVHSSFQGSLKSSIVCPECNNDSKTTFDPFIDLSLGIKDKHTLTECLDNFHKKEQLHDYDFFCKKCQAQQNPIKQFTINKLPPVLVLQLKRFEHLMSGVNQKLNDYIEFPKILDMKPYLKDNQNPDEDPSILYELIGIISHTGSVNEGHYVAFCKIENGEWFKFNDSMVTKILEKDVLKEQAYLLFYIVKHIS